MSKLASDGLLAWPLRHKSRAMRDYTDVEMQIAGVLDGEPNRTARLATVACLLSQAFDDFYWTGFYLVDPDKPTELVVGPYQGTLGCLRIPFGRGVCGIAAMDRETQVVEDVHAFPGHIACDAASQSEVVVPVFDEETLIGVLDVDSAQKGSFDQSDADALERIAAMIAI
nr:GAF domain-containing protein [Algimonas arctica]